MTTYSLHPGVIATDLLRYSLPFGLGENWGPKFINILLWPFWKSQYHGGQTTVCCAVDENMSHETGKYYR